MVEGDAGEEFSRMRLIDSEQVIEPPHPLGEPELGEDPAAAEAAKAVHLGEAIGADEDLTKVRGARTRGHGGFEIDLVHQYVSADTRGELAEGAQFRLLGKGAARVVQVRDDDHARIGGEHLLNCRDVEPKRVPWVAVKDLYRRRKERA